MNRFAGETTQWSLNGDEALRKETAKPQGINKGILQDTILQMLQFLLDKKEHL
ncbi:MAG: hypothetical protein O2964_18895 [Verrucomicrobia bacterium]|jgi:hypothetical protein|nr:hypothetical protein [Verrucomicrobiota bacterium]